MPKSTNKKINVPLGRNTVVKNNNTPGQQQQKKAYPGNQTGVHKERQ